MLAVVQSDQSDIQSSISLMESGACTNIITPSGQPLLHLALALEEEILALAMVQLLLINGANPECKDSQGRTALDLAREVVKLLVGFGAEGGNLEEDVAVTFHKYVFEEDEEKGGDQTAVKGGLQFLEQVASIFQGSLEGVKGDEVTQEQEKADTELSSVLAQIDSVGFIAGGRGMMSCPATMDRKGNSFTCSTPSRRDMLCPLLNMSSVSNISTVVGRD